jgi:hypothetical protein
MANYHGGQMVKAGYYLNRGSMEFTCISRRDGPLPGDSSKSYRRVAAPLVVLGGPVIGLCYVIFMPVISIAAFICYGLRRLAVRRKLQPSRSEA